MLLAHALSFSASLRSSLVYAVRCAFALYEDVSVAPFDRIMSPSESETRGSTTLLYLLSAYRFSNPKTVAPEVMENLH